MKISGYLNYRGSRYILSLEENLTKIGWYLVSEFHEEDRVRQFKGEELLYPVLNLREKKRLAVPLPYVLESVEKTKASGIFKVYKQRLILREVLDTLSMASAYTFAKDRILRDDKSQTSDGMLRVFEAMDDTLIFQYTRVGGYYTQLRLVYGDIDFTLNDNNVVSIPDRLPYEVIKEKQNSKLVVNTTVALDYETLREQHDLSWYEKDGVILKDYRAIQTIQEFEEQVMTPIIEELLACRARGEKLILGLDTETTGLIIYNLSPDNPDKDRMVSIPLSWKDDQGVVIFVDMEHFGNVPLDYVLSRLRVFLEASKEDIHFRIRRFDGVENVVPAQDLMQKSNAFNTLSDVEFKAFGVRRGTSHGVTWVEDEDPVVFRRSEVGLVGHNALFDGRVFYDVGIVTEWEDDTMQMAFNLNPKVIKGNNKLKSLTHRFLGAETLELSDILGKGNEGNYRYITDIRVAVIYGCADTDFTRLLRKKLVRLMNDVDPKMYKRYQRQDMKLYPRLYISEYNGMNTDDVGFKKRAEYVRQDLDTLEKWLFRFVGKVVDHANKRLPWDTKFKAGLISREEYEAGVASIDTSDAKPYDFKLKGDQLRKVLFSILKYPSVARTAPSKKFPEGQESVDKFAMEKLRAIERETPANILKADIMSSDPDETEPLLKAETFNKLRFPIAYFLERYGELSTEWTNYFKPILENNLEGKIFKGYSLARIETRRIMNPGQTMKLKLKKYVVSYGPDWYCFDWDQAQVEPRIMVSLTDDESEKEKFRDPEKDYHTETASRIQKILPHKLPKFVRKKYKEITLGLPYGLGQHKMCGKIYKKVNDDNLYQTRKDIRLWQEANSAVYHKLLEFRSQPFTEVELTDEMKHFLNDRVEDPTSIPYGMVKNLLGFYRIFDLSDMDKKKKGKIERPAGNFPIQSFAAELFRIILNQFYDKCVEYGIEDKIMWHMLIHDELFGSAHKSVHPFLLYKILYESCVVTIPGHTTYFIGINIGDSWADCKKDENEAPVKFVEEIIARWDAGEFRDDDYWNYEYTFKNNTGELVTYRGPKAYVYKHKQEFLIKRIRQVVEKVQPSAATGPVDLPYILEHMDNYMVRAYVDGFFPKNYKVEKSASDDEKYAAHFESWMLDAYGPGKEMKCLDGVTRKIYRGESTPVGIDLDDIDLDDIEDNSEEAYWTFNEEDIEDAESAATSYVYAKEEDDSDTFEAFLKQFDMSKSKDAKSVADMFVHKTPTYQHLKVVNNQIVITVPHSRFNLQIKKYLQSFKAQDGYYVIFQSAIRDRWNEPIKKDIDLKALDDFVGGVVHAYK